MERRGRMIVSKGYSLEGRRERTGFMSMTGVPSMASSGRTRIFIFIFTSASFFAIISSISTRCSPIGFGLSGDLVEKTPFNGIFGSPLG